MARVASVMSTVKVFSLGGLDKKSNDLTRAVDKASDMVNMEYDTQSTIKKRNGFAEVVIDGGSVAKFDDLIYYNSKDEFIGFTNHARSIQVLKRNGSSFTSKELIFPYQQYGSFTASLVPIDASTSTMNVTSFISGNIVVGSNVSDLAGFYGKDTYVIAFGTGTGGTGTYIVSNSQTTPGTTTFVSRFAMSNISISYCENQNNLYFNNTDYNSFVMKYDGDSLTRSGLFTPRNSATAKIDIYPSFTNPSGGFNRFFYSYKDINGNITYSPYYQSTTSITGSSVLSISSFAQDANSLVNGFFNKYCYIAKTGHTNITSLARTLTCNKHNYVAGDKFLIDMENKAISIAPTGKAFIVLDVESVVTGTSITFTSASIGLYVISFSDLSAYYSSIYPVDVRCKLQCFYSATELTGYTNLINWVIDNSSVVNSLSGSTVEAVLSLSAISPTSFEDIYDSAYLKLMPPICKYIASYGNQIAYASIQAYFTGYTNLLDAPNQRIEFANTSLITYSDISTGDGPEGTSDFNFTKIGETWDGNIAGIRRCNDSLVIFKDRGVFSIDGTLIDGQYSLRKINSNFVGCTSHKSILDADEGVYFQGHNGLYFTNGVNITKLSYEIDSVFLSGSYLNTRSVRLKKKQKSFFYVPDILSGTYKIVIIDYYYQQIYMWNSATLPSSGIVEDKNGDVYFCDGLKMYKFNDTYTDNGAAITSLYSTTWHHAGEPSLNKKWLSLRTFGLTNDAFTATITTEGDWQAGTTLTTNSSVYSSTTQTDFKMLDMQTKKSLRINFSNSTNNENMVLTGYELTYEMFNVVDKN